MEIIIIIILVAIVCEFIDSYLGMMYGTILSPVLLIAGYDPVIVIPSILFSQAMGGFIASYRHNHFKNAVFNIKSKDLKIASVIIGLGFVAVVFGVMVGVNVPKMFLKLYIGILCLFMGLVVLLKHKFKFSWRKIMLLGVVSSFNKALSGGGFGPVVVSGLVLSGRESKKAIGTTDFAEAPICIMAFLVWIMINGMFDINMLIYLTIGSCVGGYFGPKMLSKFKSKTKLTKVIGFLALTLGAWTIIKTLF